MTKKILIIDYGRGNLHALSKAFAHAGATSVVSADPKDVRSADALVLPGVGAFGDGMAALENRGFKQAVLDAVRQGKPVLGICLGMQFLFDVSHEFGMHAGLGIIPGEVKKITPPDEVLCKVPHVGWSPLMPPDGQDIFGGPLLAGIALKTPVYFAHSYAGYPENDIDVIANTWYCKSLIPSVVAKENTFGVQFHPEKSGEAGIAILTNFLSRI